MTLNNYEVKVLARLQAMTSYEIDRYVNSKRCSNCDLWMKSSLCPREKPGVGERSGYSVGPSAREHTCSSFVPNFDYDTALQVQVMKKLES
jgi:hypothetical protein|tara:strand:- start:103 stop:375 length:273 start_codon:yes stop_codon:yes gene_type:complete